MIIETTNKCPVYECFCVAHGFRHGSEAEELREELEKLIVKYRKKVPSCALERLLRTVDARDSVAYLEYRAQEASLDCATET